MRLRGSPCWSSLAVEQSFITKTGFDLYVERFNRHDWDGLRQLIAADARLQVADRFSGSFADAPYFSQYERIREQ